MNIDIINIIIISLMKADTTKIFVYNLARMRWYIIIVVDLVPVP